MFVNEVGTHAHDIYILFCDVLGIIVHEVTLLWSMVEAKLSNLFGNGSYLHTDLKSDRNAKIVI